ncbi:hypothetical protein K3495_g6985 [Podosphaera aphanis]|nr:hypothetical protein K3495_g6985 [Podosphaera aphanis]
MSSISFLNEQACSGRNITWQYLHHGHLPLSDNTQYNSASFPNHTPYNYAACPDAAAILYLHNCWGGTCHPNRWNHEFERYKWNNWNGLNDPLIRFQAEETGKKSDSVCSGMNSLSTDSNDSGLEVNHGDESSVAHEHNDLKKRDQSTTVETNDHSLIEKVSKVERRFHGISEYPHPLYPGPSLTNPSRPVDSISGRILSFGSSRGRPKASDNPSKPNLLRARDGIQEVN